MADPAHTNETTVTSELGKRLRFETLLSDLSARFMAGPLDQVDREIDQALRRIMEFFQVDRCALLEFRKDRVSAGNTHAAFGEGLEPIAGKINLAEKFPWPGSCSGCWPGVRSSPREPRLRTRRWIRPPCRF